MPRALCHHHRLDLASGLHLEYDTFGEPSDRPMVLIMGLGSQMIFWDDEFCRQLAGHGHYLVRFDNRDIGQSSYFDHHGMPDVRRAAVRGFFGRQIEAGYGLEDMAEDTFALMDALGLEQAHVCGASMGGMIAQTMAILRPERCKSLVSMMSAPDARRIRPRWTALSMMMRRRPDSLDAYLDFMVELWRRISSPDFPFHEEYIRDRSLRAHHRGISEGGNARQMVAMLASGDRSLALRRLDVPSLVIHGTEDVLVPVAHGRTTARLLANSRLLEFAGMGHDLPPALWPEIFAAISQLTEAAELGRRAA